MHIRRGNAALLRQLVQDDPLSLARRLLAKFGAMQGRRSEHCRVASEFADISVVREEFEFRTWVQVEQGLVDVVFEKEGEERTAIMPLVAGDVSILLPGTYTFLYKTDVLITLGHLHLRAGEE